MRRGVEGVISAAEPFQHAPACAGSPGVHVPRPGRTCMCPETASSDTPDSIHVCPTSRHTCPARTESPVASRPLLLSRGLSIHAINALCLMSRWKERRIYRSMVQHFSIAETMYLALVCWTVTQCNRKSDRPEPYHSFSSPSAWIATRKLLRKPSE